MWSRYTVLTTMRDARSELGQQQRYIKSWKEIKQVKNGERIYIPDR